MKKEIIEKLYNDFEKLAFEMKDWNVGVPVNCVKHWDIVSGVIF